MEKNDKLNSKKYKAIKVFDFVVSTLVYLVSIMTMGIGVFKSIINTNMRYETLFLGMFIWIMAQIADSDEFKSRRTTKILDIIFIVLTALSFFAYVYIKSIS